MATARIIWNGNTGEVWTNDTERFKYQLICDLVHTCGVCLQYHLAISNWWPIPFHRNCRCTNRPIKPGQSARPFASFRDILRDLDPIQQTEAIGRSNYRLIEAGVVGWEDIVTETRVRTLTEVVAARKLPVKTMLGAGVRSDLAEKAFARVHTPEQVLIRQHRKELVERIESAGLSREQIKESIARDISRRVSIAAGPSRASVMPTPRPNVAAEAMASPFLPPDLAAGIRRFETRPPGPRPTPAVRAGVTKVHPAAKMTPAVERAAKIANASGFNVGILPGSEFANVGAAALYRTRQDFIAINADAEFWADVPREMTYNRKQGWFSTGEEDHVIVHEIGHGRHFRSIGRIDENIAAMKALPDEDLIDLIRKEVSQYAATNRAEVVAEVYAGLAAGREFAPEIMAYYRKLGGILP